MIRAESLCRSFKRSSKGEGFAGAFKNLFQRSYLEKIAVKNVSFEIPAGTFLGLVGANGAGKTTFLKLCAGLLHPTSGSIQILGQNPSERSSEFLRNIGMVMGQKSQLWSDLSPRDSLELFAAIYDIPKPEYTKRIDELTTLFGVTKLMGVQVRRLSLGERMKFELIAALLHEPQLLFLDEPTIGLDLIAKEAVRKFLSSELRRKKITVILSSHDMEDIQEVCDQLMILSGGELKHFGTMKEFSGRDNLFKENILKLIEDPQ